VLFYMVVYTIMTIGAFGIVMLVADQGEEKLEIEDYAGFGGAHPLLAVLLTLFLLSLAGFPGTGGFIAKIYLLQGAVESNLWALAIILALTTVVSYYYYLRVAWYMWMRPSRSGEDWSTVRSPAPIQAVLVASGAVILLLGILPGGMLEAALSAAQGLGGANPGTSLFGQVP
jgi:NADH-quinone oxidoreductase subunit N